MREDELKTGLKQRIIIIAIAVVLLGSAIASYAAIIILNSSSSSSVGTIDEEKILAYEEAYAEKLNEFKNSTSADYAKFSPYRSEIKAYDESAANEALEKRDLAIGGGRELASGDTDYLAYYVGWCADGSIFDSSFDQDTDPTAFSKVLNAGDGMISGWNEGVVGMRLGGIREITVPSEKAYGDQLEICGGVGKPLKFLVMAVPNEEPLKSLATELDDAFMRMQYAYYGIDYDAIKGVN
ncbi:MAG: FKBP-type peptidyl-prolyl cis-trans isomerase [Candidatus Saccharibacteria bacterium]|nr:FKBP-type peptidyl-prolyl cis-trans isomerase [Candidatus Saccharibacteria bacterium]